MLIVGLTSYQKSDSVNRIDASFSFIWRTIVPNFIQIQFETTWLFWRASAAAAAATTTI